MKRMLALWSVFSVLSAVALEAQQREMVVPKTALTPAQKSALDAILVLRDSVLAANSAMASLRRDLEQKPANALEAQARLIADRCSAAERQRQVSMGQLKELEFTDATMITGQRGMLGNMERVKAPLAECQKTFDPLGKMGKGEEVRGYGVSRSKPIVAGLESFERDVVSFARDLGLPVRDVLRAGPSPADLPPPRQATQKPRS